MCSQIINYTPKDPHILLCIGISINRNGPKYLALKVHNKISKSLPRASVGISAVTANIHDIIKCIFTHPPNLKLMCNKFAIERTQII